MQTRDMWGEDTHEGKLRRTLIVLVLLGGSTAFTNPPVPEWTIVLSIGSAYVISLWGEDYRAWTLMQRFFVGSIVGLSVFGFLFNRSVDILRLGTLVIGLCVAAFILLRDPDYNGDTEDG